MSANPCARGGRLYRGSRVDKIWTADDEAAFLKSAPAHFHLPLLLALWTGQRQGDLLRLPWSAYDGTHIRLRQSKGGVRVVISGRRAAQGCARCRKETWAADPDKQLATPVDIARLSSVMAHRRDQGRDRRRDIPRSARHRRHAARARRMQRGRDRHHHRAHLRDVRSILDANYLHRDAALGESAIGKLERGTNFSRLNSRPNKDSTITTKERPAKSNS